MEPVFLRFDSYQFEADRRFQDGLKSLPSCREDALLDVKLFFYNRFVEPIDLDGYKKWSSASCPMTPVDGGAVSRVKTCTTEVSGESEAKQLSFAEVMRLVQEGKDVPGAKKLDIHPSNQSPTPSQMERRTKPWEQSLGTK